MGMSDQIKQWRKAQDLTQEKLAKLAGVGLRFVRDLEQGKRTLRIDKVNQVLKLFGKEVGAVDLQVLIESGLAANSKNFRSRIAKS